MIDGFPLIDVHLHVARLPTLKSGWMDWAQGFGDAAALARVYDPAGTVVPAAFDAYLAAEGVDVALLLAEYSPKVTGMQVIEDLLPVARHNPDRIKIIANVNPHLHYPLDEEVRRQLDLGAVALKIHPVHAGFAANDRAMYPAYEACQAAGIPLVVHCGTSTFPGSSNKFADPVNLDDVLRDFRNLTVVLAHGGRGWWYDAAAFMALANDRVWIELSGLPPSRLREYYAKHNWTRLTRRMIFATDWPGVPGIAANARAIKRAMPRRPNRGPGPGRQRLPRLQPEARPMTATSSRPSPHRAGRHRDARMITKEKSPIRVLFFRDHESSELRPPAARTRAGGVRALWRAGPERTACPPDAGAASSRAGLDGGQDLGTSKPCK